jgi:hypothetical protein
VCGRLLSLITKDVDVPSRLVCSTFVVSTASFTKQENELTGDVRNVVAALLLADLFNLFDVVLGKVDLLEVLSNSLRSDRLGDDTVTADLGPGEAVKVNVSTALLFECERLD